MTESTGFRAVMKSMLAPRRAAMQVIGFIAGLALVAWVEPLSV